MPFFLLINVEMPTIVGILAYEQEKIHELSMSFFITLGPDLISSVANGFWQIKQKKTYYHRQSAHCLHTEGTYSADFLMVWSVYFESTLNFGLF